jgi:cation transport ATPase
VPRSETLLALAAVVLASLAALQIPGRLLFAAAAIGLLLFLGGSRLRASLRGRTQKRTGFDAAERAEAIREARRRRMGGD